jgi:hypothetical protein
MTAPAAQQTPFPLLWLGTAASGMRSVPAGQHVTIGSHESCHLVVEHPSVAPVHLVVTPTAHGWVATDQGAPWGSWFPGGRVQQPFTVAGPVDVRVGDPSAGLTMRLCADPVSVPSSASASRMGRGRRRLLVAVIALLVSIAGALAPAIEDEFAAAIEAAERAPEQVDVQPEAHVSGAEVPAPAPAPAPPRALESLPAEPKLLPAGSPGLYDGLYSGEGPGSGLTTLLDTIYRDVHAYWGSVFADAGLTPPTANPKWPGVGESFETGCVGPEDRWDDQSAAYCSGDDVIGVGLVRAADYWSGSFTVNDRYGAELAAGEFSLVLVMAHEYGHNLQWELGLQGASEVALEAHADCLAGVWIGVLGASGRTTERDLEEVGGALARIGDHDGDSPHGTPEERYDAFRLGYDGGSIHACTPLLAR